MFVRPTGIAISFAGSAGGDDDSRPVVARIFGFAAGDEDGEPIMRDMVVPAGELVEEDLPHGFYNVQLRLPSGRILQRNVTIDEDSHETYQFFEDFAPSAGFSLQESAGRDGQAVLAEAAAASGNTSSVDYEQALTKSARQAADKRTISRDLRRFRVTPENEHDPSPPRHAALRVHQGEAPALDAAPAWESDVVVDAAELRGDAALWRIAFASDAPPQGATRRWAKVDLCDGGVEVASLPLPWFCPAGGEFSAAEMLVDPSRVGAATTVAVRDSRLAGLLAYLDRGQAGAAKPLLEQLENDDVIRDAIEGKRSNPLAACAAAYVGLAVYDPREREVWDHWLGNCMTWFPEVPDAAIVHARRLILRPTGPGDNAQAADALRRASAAGIPYFSAGVALLREMLTVLTPDHPDLAPLAEQAARLSSRVDPGQAFTVLRYAPPRETKP